MPCIFNAICCFAALISPNIAGRWPAVWLGYSEFSKLSKKHLACNLRRKCFIYLSNILFGYPFNLFSVFGFTFIQMLEATIYAITQWQCKVFQYNTVHYEGCTLRYILEQDTFKEVYCVSKKEAIKIILLLYLWIEQYFTFLR